MRSFGICDIIDKSTKRQKCQITLHQFPPISAQRRFLLLIRVFEVEESRYLETVISISGTRLKTKSQCFNIIITCLKS